jgi:pyruvate,water dikinase
LAPAGRDPVAVGAALAADRDALAAQIRAQLPRRQRGMFDIAMRGVATYEAQREGIKAAFVRLLHPLRLALAELARRSGFSHDDAFLLTLEELDQALADPDPYRQVVAERQQRHHYLQARLPPFWFEGVIPDPSTWPLRSSLAQPDRAPREIVGIGVCSGVATGTARVISDPSWPGELQPGDILVGQGDTLAFADSARRCCRQHRHNGRIGRRH